MKTRSVKLTQKNMETIEALAKCLNVSPHAFMVYAIERLVKQLNGAWEERQNTGDTYRAMTDLDIDRYEVKMRGWPPLADDD